MPESEPIVEPTQQLWTWLRDSCTACSVTAEIVPPPNPNDEALVRRLCVTTRSMVGVLAYYTGGMLIDHGWLRMFGAASDRLPRNAAEWSARWGYWPAGNQWASALIVADDVLGGVFAINGGGLGESGRGNVFYFAPDSLKWEDLGLTHNQFVATMITDRISKFYANLRWPGWEAETELVPGDRVIGVYPPLWTVEGKSPAKASRRTIPLDEHMGLYIADPETGRPHIEL